MTNMRYGYWWLEFLDPKYSENSKVGESCVLCGFASSATKKVTFSRPWRGTWKESMEEGRLLRGTVEKILKLVKLLSSSIFPNPAPEWHKETLQLTSILQGLLWWHSIPKYIFNWYKFSFFKNIHKKPKCIYDCLHILVRHYPGIVVVSGYPHFG